MKSVHVSIGVFALVLFFVMNVTGSAAEVKKAKKSEPVEPVVEGYLWPDRQVKLGLEGHRYKYVEPDFMEDKGLLYGVHAGIFWNRSFFYGFEGRYVSGSVNYSSRSTGTYDGEPYSTYELRAPFGVTLPVQSESIPSAFRLFSGLAFRRLKDSGAGTKTSTGALGYDRYSHYYYMPLGASWTANFGSSQPHSAVRFEATAEYEYFLSGKQYTDLSTASPTLGDLENSQSKGKGWRASLEGGVPLGDFFFLGSVFYRRWDIEASDLVSIPKADGSPSGLYGREPKNNTVELGVRVGVEFALPN